MGQLPIPVLQGIGLDDPQGHFQLYNSMIYDLQFSTPRATMYPTVNSPLV